MFWMRVRRAVPAGTLALVLGLGIGPMLTGCGAKIDQQLGEARQLAPQQPAQAVMRLKALLQEQPDVAEARYLLGTSLLALGDAAQAETELRRALALGHPAEQAAPPLARAQLMLDHTQALIQTWGQTTLADAAADTDLKTSVAQAHAQRGDLPAARAVLTQMLQRQPSNLSAQLLQARLEAVAGDAALAQRRVDAAVAARPDSAEAWSLDAELAAQRGDTARAVQSNQRAIAHQPNHVRAHAALIGLYLAQHQTDAAKAQLQAMRKALPGHPQALLFEGQIAYQQGDYARAQDVFQRLLKSAPDNLLLLQSAGATAMRLNLPAQAERHLSRALQLAPDLNSARRLLAQSQLGQGQSARALATLEPLLRADAPDAAALTLAAQARLLSGDGAGAEALFRRAADRSPEDGRLRTALALTHAWQGQPERGLAELRQTAERDRGISADLALLGLHWRARDWPSAMAVVASIERKQPDQPLPALLRGQLLLAQGQAGPARKAFDEALRRRPDDVAATTALAQLDLNEGRAEPARQRMAALVQAQPGSVSARLAQADLVRRSGAGPAAVAALLQGAVKAAPADRTARLALIDHHLVFRQGRAALDAAQAAVAALPDDSELLARLGQCQLAEGERQQAQASFGRLTQLQPKSPVGYIGLARAQMAARDPVAADKTVRRGLEAAPSPALQQLAVSVALQSGQPDQARQVARQAQAQRPGDAAGWLLEAEVAASQHAWPEAVALLKQASTRDQPGLAPQRLHKALQRASQPAEAQAFAQTWLKQHPDDHWFRIHLGDEAREAKDWVTAERLYQAVVDQSPTHGVALNNLAWVLLQQRRPSALAIAQRAVQALPGEPAALDTLAAALADAGQASAAVAAQERALALAPGDAELQAHLRALKQGATARP